MQMLGKQIWINFEPDSKSSEIHDPKISQGTQRAGVLVQLSLLDPTALMKAVQSIVENNVSSDLKIVRFIALRINIVTPSPYLLIKIQQYE